MDRIIVDDGKLPAGVLPETAAGEILTAPSAPPVPNAMTAMNGSVFAIGELLPWKGVYFKLVDLNTNGEITLQSVGLTKKCVKRLIGRR